MAKMIVPDLNSSYLVFWIVSILIRCTIYSMPEEITFGKGDKGDKTLRGTLFDVSDIGVILCPPHPLMGGSRYDARIVHLANELSDQGISALCMDYGEYGKGITPSTTYHSANRCKSSFSLIPMEISMPTKSTLRDTCFWTDLLVYRCIFLLGKNDFVNLNTSSIRLLNG